MFYKSFGRRRFPKTRIGRQMFHTTIISRLFCTCETFEVSDVKTCVKLQRHLSKCKHFHQEAEMNVHCSRTRQEIFRAKHFSKTQKHSREMSSTLISSDIKLCANVSFFVSSFKRIRCTMQQITTPKRYQSWEQDIFAAQHSMIFATRNTCPRTSTRATFDQDQDGLVGNIWECCRLISVEFGKETLQTFR